MFPVFELVNSVWNDEGKGRQTTALKNMYEMLEIDGQS